MVESWRERVDQGGVGSLTLDAHEQLTALTLDVIGKCGFGQDFNVRANPSCYFAQAGKILSLEAVKRAYQPRWMWYLDTKRAAGFKRALQYYHQMVADIRRGRESEHLPKAGSRDTNVADIKAEPVDMLSTMIRARDKSTGSSAL